MEQNELKGLLKGSSEKNRVVNVVDCPMGCGKTSAIINYIDSAMYGEHFIYCTPYIDEAKRVAECCQRTKITPVEKSSSDGRKMTSFKNYIHHGDSVACTHSLFSIIEDDTVDMIQEYGYTLIVDEAFDVIQSLSGNIYKEMLFWIEIGMVDVDQESGRVSFTDQAKFEACLKKYKDAAILIQRGIVCLENGKILVQIFPVNVLNAFKRIVVMTYLFAAHPIYYYLVSCGYSFNRIGVRKTPRDEFELCPQSQSDGFRYNVADKIHIYDGKKLNSIGERRHSLSSSWYKNNKYKETGVKQLGRNYANLQKNIWKCSCKDFMWTCFAGYEDGCGGIDKLIARENKNIAKGHVACTARAENKYSDRHYLAFGINWSVHPNTYNYFKAREYTMDRDKWALSMMLQWIWRSAIRNGEDIYIYVPSKKMRTLLLNWIEEVSEGGDAIEG